MILGPNLSKIAKKKIQKNDFRTKQQKNKKKKKAKEFIFDCSYTYLSAISNILVIYFKAPIALIIPTYTTIFDKQFSILIIKKRSS